MTMESDLRRLRHSYHLAVASLALVVVTGRTPVIGAQQPPPRPDTTLRADYRDLADLLQKLPTTPPPAFDESRALWLAALPLACLDRLQSRPAARGGGGSRAGTTNAPARVGDTTVTAARATTAQGPAPLSAPTANSGAGYFWIANYTLVSDHDRLRAFWGCNDWHSSVGSTWATVRLLRNYPNSALHELAREKLNAHLGKSNLEGEFSFFRAAAAAINPIPSSSQTGLFERPYGFAWLLKLQSELRTWPDTQARRWASNVAPMAAWIADSLGAFYTKLVEPVRSGAQNNTALSMNLALDYTDVARDVKLRGAVTLAARKLYLADTSCATQSERVVAPAAGRGGRGAGRGGGRGASADSASRPPAVPNDLTAAAGRGAALAAPGGGGVVIHSPCLTEAALMSRVLDPAAFVTWLGRFLPPLESGRFAPLTEPVNIPVSAPPAAPVQPLAAPPDTSAAATALALATERARLAGLSFARAHAIERIARALPAGDARVRAWHQLSAIQADRGFALMRDDAAGAAWLPAQALLYLSTRK